jgi:hypothetical protein
MPSRGTDPSAMGHSLPEGGGYGRVIRFRPRGAARRWTGPASWEIGDRAPPNDLARFERLPVESQPEPDSSHRTLVNILAAGVVIGLMLIGGWVTGTMAAIEGDQECALSDPSHCPPIYVPYIPARERNKPYPFL